MKKVIIAAFAVAVGFAAQAATFNWKSSANAMGVDLTAVDGNGTFGIGSQTMKVQGGTAWTAVLALYTDGTLVGEASVSTIKWSTTGSKFNVAGLSIDGAENGTSYNYVLTITGAPAGLTGLASSEWDYTDATMSTTLAGSITTSAMGDTTLTSGLPSSWTITGAQSIPEPTSGLLLLLGVAGLVLKRKRA